MNFLSSAALQSFKDFRLILGQCLQFNKNLYFFIDEPGRLKFEVENQEIHETVKRKRGDRIAIICVVNDRGNPKGTLQWNKSSSVMALDNVNQVSLTTISLDFINLKKQDNGTYTCSIGNEVGIQKKSFQLVVLGEVSSEWYHLLLRENLIIRNVPSSESSKSWFLSFELKL